MRPVALMSGTSWMITVELPMAAELLWLAVRFPFNNVA